jgi:hypothetical protein
MVVTEAAWFTVLWGDWLETRKRKLRSFFRHRWDVRVEDSIRWVTAETCCGEGYNLSACMPMWLLRGTDFVRLIHMHTREYFVCVC